MRSKNSDIWVEPQVNQGIEGKGKGKKKMYQQYHAPEPTENHSLGTVLYSTLPRATPNFPPRSAGGVTSLQRTPLPVQQAPVHPCVCAAAIPESGWTMFCAAGTNAICLPSAVRGFIDTEGLALLLGWHSLVLFSPSERTQSRHLGALRCTCTLFL